MAQPQAQRPVGYLQAVRTGRPCATCAGREAHRRVPRAVGCRLLAQYAQSKGEQVQPLFFVSGRAKGGGSAHSIKIGTDVDGAAAHC